MMNMRKRYLALCMVTKCVFVFNSLILGHWYFMLNSNHQTLCRVYDQVLPLMLNAIWIRITENNMFIYVLFSLNILLWVLTTKFICIYSRGHDRQMRHMPISLNFERTRIFFRNRVRPTTFAWILLYYILRFNTLSTSTLARTNPTPQVFRQTTLIDRKIHSFIKRTTWSITIPINVCVRTIPYWNGQQDMRNLAIFSSLVTFQKMKLYFFVMFSNMEHWY